MAENNMNPSTPHLSPEDFEPIPSSSEEENTFLYSDIQTGETAAVSSDSTDDGTTLPAAPEAGVFAAPTNTLGVSTSSDNDYGLTQPVAPEGGIPAYPQNTPWSSPVITLPVFPSSPGFVPCTACNSSQNQAQVRFLNASTNAFPVNVSIDNTTYASNARFGTIFEYNQISDGFHTVTIRRAAGLRTVLLQQTLPFTGGQKYTLVLVDTASGGLALNQISDTGCSNLNYNTGCYRVANMSYGGSSYDIMLYSHDAVFRNVGFREVTSYKQAMAGSYQFYITNASTFSVIRELPMIVIGTITGSGFSSEPLVSYQADITSQGRYTTYLLGNNWSDTGFRVLTVAD